MIANVEPASTSELRSRWAKDKRHTRLLPDADRERRRARGRRAREQEAEQLQASTACASPMTIACAMNRLETATLNRSQPGRQHRHLRLVVNNERGEAAP